MSRLSIKWPFILLAVVALVFSTGFKVKKKYFGPDKTYALVSIMAFPKIGTEGSKNLAGFFKAAGKKYSLVKNTIYILRESKGIVEEKLGQSNSFKLAPKEDVINSSNYGLVYADRPGRGRSKFIPAGGYKLFYKDRTLGKLAKKLSKELNLDGIIFVRLKYFVGYTQYVKKKIFMVRVVGAGKQKAVAWVKATAYNKKGKIVWEDTEKEKSKSYLKSTGGAADFEKMRPLFLEATQIASTKLIQKLDEKVGK